MKKLNAKTKIILLSVLIPVKALILAFLILCIVTMCMFPPAYLGRVLIHWDSKVTDYEIFPERVISKGESPYTYEKSLDPSLGKMSITNYTLENFVKRTDTTSLIIIRNDKIVYEQYGKGYNNDSVYTSFSMAKSVVSLMIGKAIENGNIKGVEEPVKNYIPEFADKEIGNTTIKELLLMRSGIVYDEDKFLWFGDDSLTYWHPDLRTLALSHTQTTESYGGKFHYNNYHPLLLGIVLERATGVSVSEFFSREIWSKIGAEHNATWSLDSDETGFEKMESGINFRPYDFLKIGSTVLHGGFWNGNQIINSDWLTQSTACEITDEYAGTFLENADTGYKYMWYNTAEGDIVAWGKSDQMLFISPSTQTVILRTGKSDGGVSWLTAMRRINYNLILNKGIA